jgi:hypothetical protein
MKLDIRFLIGWFVFGAVVGAVASQLSTRLGMAFPVTDAFLATSLVAIGLAIYGATFPIFRYRNQVEKTQLKNLKRPDPLLSFRLLVLARAVMITGLGFMGWHLGQLVWLWLFSIAASGLVLPTLAGVAASLLLYLGGLGAEYNCRLPKDPDGETA